ncbi:hypothetical protein BLNAU_8608 [Blattamonas nauphoetae]|uniref:Uncharacterized protein n=1 Tax=Blattamonas nauphoetae TaxID=2049346 RepID=A0ABQ9XY17_9EUKA|nr:hypothetical protein BLNAU_8608 [Blattamonas nauphoetae]
MADRPKESVSVTHEFFKGSDLIRTLQSLIWGKLFKHLQKPASVPFFQTLHSRGASNHPLHSFGLFLSFLRTLLHRHLQWLPTLSVGIAEEIAFRYFYLEAGECEERWRGQAKAQEDARVVRGMEELDGEEEREIIKET